MALRLQSSAPRAVPARASSSLACLPDLLNRPTARPLRCSTLVAVWRRRILWGAQLNEVEDFKVICTQEPDPIAVAEVELHRLVVLVRPFKPVHVEVIAQELDAGRTTSSSGAVST